jgi:hypothetical protein
MLSNEKIKNLIDLHIICTYNLIEDGEESDMLYKIQFLQILKQEEYDEKIINNKIEKLYNILKNNNLIKKILNNKKHTSDDLVNFMFLFRYDTLYLFHKILINIFNNKLDDINLYEEIIKI